MRDDQTRVTVAQWEKLKTMEIYITFDIIPNEFNEFTSMLINRSVKNFNTPVSSTDRILTLSTCYNATDKVVLHAKLIKREIRN
jgi:hypothetical protein